MLEQVKVLKLKPLSPAIGAIVEGVNLAESLDAPQFDALQTALVRHQVLFFRGQQLSPLQHRDFAARFGPLHVHPIYPKLSEAPEVIVLDSAVTDLQDNALWHTDVTFTERPPMGSVLLARMVPETGGDTLWASCAAAYEALSPALQKFLQTLTATHDIAQSFPVERFGSGPEAAEKLAAAKRANPPVTHPVVRTHPVSKRRGLFVQPGFTTHINELASAESRALLDFLFQHSVRPEFTVRWKWSEGDVAFWDNRNTLHYATDDYRPARRVMNRATIIGDRPV
jgi:taurine dioxygenase